MVRVITYVNEQITVPFSGGAIEGEAPFQEHHTDALSLQPFLLELVPHGEAGLKSNPPGHLVLPERRV